MKTMRAMLLGMAVAATVGCAGPGAVRTVERVQRSGSVDQRMLEPAGAAGASASVQRYQMQAQERFRMPQPLQADTPALAADSPRTQLPPTTVCVRLVLDASGIVQRIDPLDDRPECAEGVATGNADLMQAVRTGLMDWRFEPAAVCHWPAGTEAPQDAGDCKGAERIEPVPVSLLYAFTFEIREGRSWVRESRPQAR